MIISSTQSVLLGSANMKTHSNTYQPGKKTSQVAIKIRGGVKLLPQNIFMITRRTLGPLHRTDIHLGTGDHKQNLSCETELKYQAFTLANLKAIGGLIRVNCLY